MSKPSAGEQSKPSGSEPWRIVDAEFVAAARAVDQLPAPLSVELAFAGRSNVGKSSLLNALVERRRLVRTSSAPGCTRGLNFFRARCRDGAMLTLVDLPGYGYAKRSKTERAAWARLVEGYLRDREWLRAVVVLVDARHGPTAQDRELLAFLEHSARARPQVVVVATKADKLAKSKRRAELRKLAAGLERRVIPASAVTGEGRAEIWQALREHAGVA